MNVCRKKISRLSGIVLYRPEHHKKRDITEFNFEALEMQKLNTPTDVAHLGSYRFHWSIYHVYFDSYGH